MKKTLIILAMLLMGYPIYSQQYPYNQQWVKCIPYHPNKNNYSITLDNGEIVEITIKDNNTISVPILIKTKYKIWLDGFQEVNKNDRKIGKDDYIDITFIPTKICIAPKSHNKGVNYKQNPNSSGTERNWDKY